MRLPRLLEEAAEARVGHPLAQQLLPVLREGLEQSFQVAKWLWRGLAARKRYRSTGDFVYPRHTLPSY